MSRWLTRSLPPGAAIIAHREWTGRTVAQYEEHLEANLPGLLDRAKSGAYLAPPVKRVYVPKDNGESRPIGIPTTEDKVLGRAIVMLLEPIYEEGVLRLLVWVPAWTFGPSSAGSLVQQAARGVCAGCWKWTSGSILTASVGSACSS